MVLSPVSTKNIWQSFWPPVRRALYLLHRWLGIAGCVLFVMWFISGLVMLHVRFPSLTPQERLQGLKTLSLEEITVAPADALRLLGLSHPRTVVLERQGADGMVWRIVDQQGDHHAVSASGAKPAQSAVSPVQATAIAAAFGGTEARFVETRERDQWTMPNASAFEQARPLHRLALDDAAGTELYVSAKTGEVMRDTTAHERLWTTFGTLLHYYTYAPIRQHAGFWRQLVLWTSGLAMFSAATGIIIGTLRVRLRRRYRGTSITPYRGWMAWHHLAGLLGGIFILTWVFSGWFSMSPNQWLSRPGTERLKEHFAGAGPIFTHSVDSLHRLPLPEDGSIKAVEAAWFDRRPTYTIVDARGRRQTFDAVSAMPIRITTESVQRAAHDSSPGVALDGLGLLSAPDRYWYGRHVPPVLPVWRIKLSDSARTWLHVDAVSGQVLDISTSKSRLRRWLFHGLHSLDFFPSLINTAPWYAAIWILSLLGLCVSVSGVVLGVRRLRGPTRHRSPSSATAKHRYQ
ncbi:PepSY-associated TM helix domain-containing protein [Stenotrophomonas sp. S41]|uniref:PepSY-associated TM helix domain-containing protein n=1 Tax=Stenotrophomonas sp. S41 TaxID=2767464 RepID=UPI00190D2BF7|nr:PepSY-associated TM helix domain-containing protein [Stenotrophomonas sp. S41]MBK0010777.1 PepSY domain-containing protein [Stenotrophomonas sp. S41]